MKVAICHRNNSFSDGWIDYCERHNIEYKLVNVYSSNIIEILRDFDVFMWHFHHSNYKDVQFAKQLIKSLETIGIKVFPDTYTCWHFDNKVAQKYLLECINAPMVPSYVFYTQEEAMEWASGAKFPKVFKLKGGAGASNVKLALNKNDAIKYIRRSFGKGFTQYRAREIFVENYRKYKLGLISIKKLFSPLYIKIFNKYGTDFNHYQGREIGYAYFQDFIPNNTFDIRICVVGKNAFGLKRLTRKNDFRASGSGSIIYDKESIDERCVQIAFEVNKKLKMQSVAFDFIFDHNNNPLIVEISYGYTIHAYKKCEGYWTDDMEWHPGEDFDICGWMVENLIK